MATTIFRGLAFPFQQSTTELPASATDDDLIRQDLIQLLLTSQGERIMRPDLGSLVLSFLFESNTDLLASNIRTVVGALIAQFDPRVVVRNISVERTSSDGTDLDSVLVTIKYVVVATQREGQVAVQFGTGQGAT